MTDDRKERSRRALAAIAALALAVGSGCGRRYWTPKPEHWAAAAEIAKLAVLQRVSDQAGDPEVQSLRYRAGEPVEPPVVFTIRDVPFSRYRSKMWGARHGGRRLVIVEYFDPSRLPDWERDDARGEFPAHIVVATDPVRGVVEEPVPFDVRRLRKRGTSTP